MKILVINGECIEVNASSNLCNLAYLQGLLDIGAEVTLLSSDGSEYRKDPALSIPEGIKCFSYDGFTLYEKLSRIKKRNNASPAYKPATDTVAADAVSRVGALSKVKKVVVSRAKKAVMSLYGVHGIYAKFVWKAVRFRSNEQYDLVISLATPASSHLLAEQLIKSGHVKCRHWVQVWEDPWFGDVTGFTKYKRIYREEKRLLRAGEWICYVSPLTLENQKKLYAESADKMFWVPLPAYYEAEKSDASQVQRDLFGYFGEYSLPVRDIRPFYEAARNTGIEVNICGNTNLKLMSTDRILIHPRLDLFQLKPIEARTGVLVYLCNCTGGQIPGKIYQYAATDKTILFILDGTDEEQRILTDFFEPFKRFIFCRNDHKDIERAIRLILEDDLGEVKNESLTRFKPDEIVKEIIEKGMREQNE